MFAFLETMPTDLLLFNATWLFFLLFYSFFFLCPVFFFLSSSLLFLLVHRAWIPSSRKPEYRRDGVRLTSLGYWLKFVSSSRPCHAKSVTPMKYFRAVPLRTRSHSYWFINRRGSIIVVKPSHLVLEFQRHGCFDWTEFLDPAYPS